MPDASGRSTVEVEGASEEHVSPELALVDPELAEKAREQLPDPQQEHRPQPEAFEPAELRQASFRPRRRRGRAVAVGVLSVVAVLGAVGIGIAAAQLLNDEPVVRVEQASSAAAQAAPLPAAPATAGGVAPATTSPEANDGSTPDAPASGARTFGWVLVERARYYHVSFFRGATKIYEGWPRRPPLVLPSRWTYNGRQFALGPGVYRWVVRPGFGPRRRARYGPPIVDASLVIRS